MEKNQDFKVILTHAPSWKPPQATLYQDCLNDKLKNQRGEKKIQDISHIHFQDK